MSARSTLFDRVVDRLFPKRLRAPLHGRRHPPVRKKAIIEALEQRLLLSVDPTFGGAASIVAGTDVNVSKAPFSQTEVSIAVNPVDPGNLVVMSNGGLGPNGTSPLRAAEFTAYSQDAGKSWQTRPITITEDGRDSADRFDGATVTDEFGNVHIVYMRRPQPTAADPNRDIVYARSEDGGATYKDFRVIAHSSSNDKPWIAVGPDAATPGNQAVWISFTDKTAQRIYITGASISALGSVGPLAPVVRVSDTNSGSNYSVPTVGPNGEVAVTWMNPSGGQGPATIFLDRDLDGLANGITMGADITVATTNAGGFDFIPATPERSTFSSPYIMYDNSRGPNRGRMYMAYANETPAESSDFDVLVIRSDDDGSTWSAPVTVNDDGGTSSQFFQNIAVDPTNGAVWLAWYDTRNDLGAGGGAGNIDTDGLANTETQFYASVSVDGGTSFRPNVRVSDGASDEDRDNDPADNDYGDYTGIAAYGGMAFTVWADNSNSTGDNPRTNRTFDVYMDRLLLDWSGNQTVTITGTSGNDTYLIRPDETGLFLQFFENTPATGVPTYTAPVSEIASIVINGGAGNDQFLIESLGAAFTGSITVNGGDDADLLFDLHGIAPASISAIEAISRTTVQFTGLPTWQEQGPGVINGGLTAGIEQKAISGAIQAVLVDDRIGQENTIYIGSVNGGVWKTTNGGTTWTPLTDQFPSLSISALAFDLADASRQTVYAATGKVSSYGSEGQAAGLLKTTDGGKTWGRVGGALFDDKPIHTVYASGDTVLVAVENYLFSAADRAANGLYRSSDGGKTFEHIAGEKIATAAVAAGGTGYVVGDVVTIGGDETARFEVTSIGAAGAVTGVKILSRGVFSAQATNPVATASARAAASGLTLNLTYYAAGSTLARGAGVTEFVVDPGNPNQVFIGVPGQGVFRSIDKGETFTAVNTGLDFARAERIRLSISSADVGGNRPLYAAIIREPQGTLTAQANAGATVIQLSSAADFVVGDKVTFVAFGGTAAEERTLSAVDRTANTITLSSGLSNARALTSVVTKSGANNVNTERVSLVFRSGDSGANWVSMGRPGDADGGISFGGQALKHFSMVAHPTDPNVVFVGGDLQKNPAGAFPNAAGATNFTGRLFRGAFNAGSGAWAPITDSFADPDGGGAAKPTGPHADSRNMVFTNGTILEVDDGGIYRLINPDTATGRQWVSLNNNLRLTEFVSVGYDNVNDIIIGGAQDNGVLRQDAQNNQTWTHLIQGDGQVVQVANIYPTSGDPSSTKYASAQNLGQFQAFTDLDPKGDSRGLEINGTGIFDDDDIYQFDSTIQFGTPVAINAVDPKLIMIGTQYLYEEDPDFLIGGDTADDLTLQNGSPVWAGFFSWKPPTSARVGTVTALVYGGRENPNNNVDQLVDKARIAYAGVWDKTDVGGVSKQVGKLLLRRGEGQDFIEVESWRNGAPGGGYIRDIALNPHDWRKLYVVDHRGSVWMGEKDSASPNDFVYKWTDITGNLDAVAGRNGGTDDDRIDTVEVVIDPGANKTSTTDDREILLVGGQGGVFRLIDTKTSTHWSEFGAGMPNTLVTDIHYDAKDDLLLAGTLGRGAFTIGNALASLTKESVLTITGTSADDALRLVVDAARPWMLDLYATNVGGTEPAKPIKSFDMTGLDRIQINTLGGNDVVTLDESKGVISLAGGIMVNGGAGTTDALRFVVGKSLLTATPVAGTATGAEVRGSDGFGEWRLAGIGFSDVESTPELATGPVAPAPSVSNGLQGLESVFGDLLQKSLKGENLPFVNAATINSGIGGTVIDVPNPLSLPRAVREFASQVSAGGIVQIASDASIFDRILETGLSALDLQGLTEGNPSVEELRSRLDALDGIVGNVAVTESGGTTTFDVEVVRRMSGIIGVQLDGSAVLDSINLGDGQLTLEGQAEIGFDAKLDITFGVDDQGFFIAPNASGAELSVTKIALDGSNLKAEGAFGFLGVEVSGATVTFDQALGLNFKFKELASETADGKIRLPELGNLATEGRVEFRVDSPGTQDLQVQANLKVLPVLPGLGAIFPISDSQMTLTWADLETSTPTGTTSGGGIADFKNFLELDPAELIGQFRQLSASLGDVSVNVDLDIPFIDSGFDQLVDLVGTFDTKVLSGLFVDDGNPLSNIPSFDTIQDLVASLSASLNDPDIGYLIDLTDLGDFVTYDAATKSVLFDVEFSKTFEHTEALELGFDLEEGLADLDFNADATISAELNAHMTIGLDLGAAFRGESPTEWLFLKDTSITASLTITADNIDASARFGFLGIQIVDGSAILNGTITVSLTDPGVGAEADGRITIGELLSGLSSPSSLIDFELSGAGQLTLPVSVPFLGITASSSTALTVTLADLTDANSFSVNLPPALTELDNFNNMSAAGFVGLLGQITNWLDEFRQSDFYSGLDLPIVGPGLDAVLDFADSLRDGVLIDDLDNSNDADDIEKLVDRDNNPTFQTAQQLEEKLSTILGLPQDLVTYDAVNDILAVHLDFSQVLAPTDLPINLGFDLGPLLNLETDSTLRVSADAGLTFTIGLYLGAAPSASLLTDSKSIKELRGYDTENDSTIKLERAITAPNDVKTVYGRLSADAKFKVAVNGGADVEVIVLKSATDANNTVDDLVSDLTAALSTAGLGGKIQGGRDGNKLKLTGIGSTTAFTLGSDSSNAGAKELGFGGSLTAETVDGMGLVIRGKNEVPAFVGRLTADAVFQVSVDGGAPVTVTLDDTLTAPNKTIIDVVVDVNAALKAAGLGDTLVADSLDKRLIISAKNASTQFTITAVAGNPAVTELGLATSQTADQTDLIVYTRDGTSHKVSLDGAATVGDIRNRFQTQTGGKVAVAISEGARLTFTDTTSGSSQFRIETANKSKIGIHFGFARVDATGDETPDGKIESAFLGDLELIDRLFLEDVEAHANLDISTPGGINALARFGFVSVTLDGDGSFNGAFRIGLTDPGTVADDGRISFRELFDGLEDFDSLIPAPELTGGGHLELTLGLDPAIPGINLGTDPQLVVDLLNFGDFFGQFPDSVDFATVTRIDSSSFYLSGDQREQFMRGSDVTLALSGGGSVASKVQTVSYDSATNRTTVTIFDAGITGAIASANFKTPIAPSLRFQFPDLGDLIAFDNPEFGFEAVLDALVALGDFLSQFEEFGFLNEPIPLINVSVNDVLAFAERFQLALEEARNDPAGTLQTLEAKLKQAFGLPADSPAFDISLLRDGGTEIIKFDLGMAFAFSETLPLNLQLGLPDFAELAGNADLYARGNLNLDLDFGIDLNDPLNFYIFDTTGIHGDLSVGGEDLAFTAALGPLGLRIKEGTADLTLEFDANLNGGSVFVGGRALIEDVLADLGDAIDVSLTGTVGAMLPAYFPTESLFKGNVEVGGSISVSIDDGLVITPTLAGNKYFSIPPDLFSISPRDFSLMDNILLAIDGIDAFLAGLQDVMDGELFGIELPLVGDKLSSAAHFIEDFREGFLEDFRREVENFANPDQNFISVKLFELLGPSGLNILRDGADAGTDINVTDVLMTTNVDETGINPRDVFMQWNLNLGGSVVDAGAGINFDIGLPGLGFETRGAVDVDLSWNLEFGFGINFREGFYLDIASGRELGIDLLVTVPGGGITGKLGILQIDADDNGNTHLAATFGVNVVNRRDEEDEHLSFGELASIGLNPGIAAEAVIDLGLDLQLNSDLVPGADKAFPKIVGDFYFEWGFGSLDPDNFELVSFSQIGNAIKDGLKVVEFRDVGIDLGSFISDFVGPIVHEIQKITEPLQPVIDVITAPIPIISQLAGRTITMIDLAGMTGYVKPELIYAIASIIELVNSIPDPEDVGTLIIPFGDFTVYSSSDPATTGRSIWSKGFNASTGIERPNMSGYNFSGAVNGLNTQGDSKAQTTKEFTNGLANKRFGDFISFPIFQDPGQIFGLLLGQEASLIEIDLPPLDFKFTWSQFFSIFGPLGVSINATFRAFIDFPAFGYDTFGLREFFDGGFRNPELLIDGFYVSDLVDGQDVPELTLSGFISATAELNLGIAKAGVGGGLGADIFFNLHDPNEDGKVRLDEFATNVLNEFKYGEPLLSPLAIFDVTGQIYARLFAFLKVDLFLFSIDKEFNIVPPITIVDFEIPFTRIPTLGKELSDGVLQLNLGPQAGQRLEGDERDIAEEFYVKQGADAGHVLVWAPSLGVTEAMAQEYEVTSKIVALGGEGDDIIDLSRITNGSLTYDLEGGAGNDTILLAATAGAAKVKGGTGDDHIVTGAGSDLIIGEGGNDFIDAGAGADLVFADAARIKDEAYEAQSRLTDGNDTIIGGAGDDVLIGGGGADLIGGDLDPSSDDPGTGPAGNDTIFADGAVIMRTGSGMFQFGEIKDTNKSGGGNDTVYGHLGNDMIYGGRGDDMLKGGGGNDVIYAEDGLDRIFGGEGLDTIDGGKDSDQIDAGTGNDTVHGGEGNDTIWGRTGADTIYGEAGIDIIFGHEDNDTIYGGSDGDKIYGGGGADYIDAGGGGNLVYGDDKPGDPSTGAPGGDTIIALNGDDTIYGQAGDDSIQSGEGVDLIVGGTGNDAIITGGGNKTVWGDEQGKPSGSDDGNDTIVTGGGNDFIRGSGGNDNIRSGGGIDTVYGDDGNDTIRGGAGGDFIYGNAGTDTIYANEDAAGSTTEAAANWIEGGLGNDTIYGDAGPDAIFGDENDDTIYGRGGNDLIVGGFGDDDLFGDGGSDVIWGGTEGRARSYFDLSNAANFENPAGWDAAEVEDPTGFHVPRIAPVIFGGLSWDGESGDGKDEIDGGAGIDFVFGGGDDDVLHGGADSDYVDGGVRIDEVYGDGGDDIVRGGANDDVLHGDFAIPIGESPIRGGEGIDQVYGDGGSDIIFGDAGRTRDVDGILRAGLGGDSSAAEHSQAGQRLYGGAGIDFLYAFAEVSFPTAFDPLLLTQSFIDTQRANTASERALRGGGIL